MTNKQLNDKLDETIDRLVEIKRILYVLAVVAGITLGMVYAL